MRFGSVVSDIFLSQKMSQIKTPDSHGHEPSAWHLQENNEEVYDSKSIFIKKDILPLPLEKMSFYMTAITQKTPVAIKDEKLALLQDIDQYIRKNQPANVITWRLLGGRKFMYNKPVSSLDFVMAGVKGIPKSSVTALAYTLNIPMRMMAHILNLSEKTLGRKKSNDLLDQLSSSLSIEIAQTIARGLEVFEERDKFNRWLQKENRALKGQKPFDLLSTPTGIKLVNEVLGRIEDGVYS